MSRLIPRRLWVPLGYVLAGTALAAAWLAHGGVSWWLAFIFEAAAVGRAVVVYRRGGQDSDEGALAASRADERQRFLRTRAQALAGVLAMAAAFIGLTIAIAVKAAAWWPFLAVFAVAAFGYVYGLQFFGAGEDAAAEDSARSHGW
jgi:hypothetical protein